MDPENVPFAPNTGRLWTRRGWIAGSLAGLAMAGCSRPALETKSGLAKDTIRILIWADYFADIRAARGPDALTVHSDIHDNVITAFEEQTGIKVEVRLFESNEELYSLLTAKEASYDVAMPSGFMVRRLQAEGWLRRIPASAVPNSRHIDFRRFKLQFDPEMAFALPYVWGSIGIAFDTQVVDGIPRHWIDLFDRSNKRDDETIKAAMSDDGRFTLNAALICLGYPPDSHIPSQLEAAAQLLRSQRSRIGSLESHSIGQKLAAGSINLALATSGDVAFAMRRNKRIRLSLPAEGSLTFKDCFVLPISPAEKQASSPGRAPAWTERQVNAARFLDFVLQPEMAALVTNFSCYATTLNAARAFVDRNLLNGAAYFLNPAGKDFSIEQSDPNNVEFNRVWNEVRSLWPARPRKTV